jgi:hypothetical protein
MKETSVPKRKLRSRSQRKAEALIREAIQKEQELQLEYPEIHILRWQDDEDYRPLHTLEVTDEEITIAARLLVAFSRVGAEGFQGWVWKEHLEEPMHWRTAWKGFFLLEKLKMAACEPCEDPCDRGVVWIARGIVNKYPKEND